MTGMEDRRSEELIRRNRELLSEAERIRIEAGERAERARLRRAAASRAREMERPRSDLFHEGWKGR